MGVHYPTDILCGALLGSLFAILIYLIYKKTARRMALPLGKEVYLSRDKYAIPLIYLLTVAMLLLLSL